VARIPRTTGTTPNTDPNFAQAKAEFMKELKKLPNVTFLTKKQSKAVFGARPCSTTWSSRTVGA